jgi:hypothetical protein
MSKRIGFERNAISRTNIHNVSHNSEVDLLTVSRPPSGSPPSRVNLSPRVFKGFTDRNNTILRQGTAASTDSFYSVSIATNPLTAREITSSHTHFLDLLPQPICLIGKEGFLFYRNTPFASIIKTESKYAYVNVNFLSFIDVKDQSRAHNCIVQAYSGTPCTLDRCLTLMTPSPSAISSHHSTHRKLFDWSLTYDQTLAVIIITGR